MGLAAIVRSAVATANGVTSDLQVAVTHEAWTGVDGQGSSSYAAGVSRDAIVEHKQRLVRTAAGEMLMARARLMFLEPIPDNGATGRREPIDPRDRITLPDGSTGPILDVQGMTDPATDRPYALEVFLG